MSALSPDAARALRMAYRDLFFLAGRLRDGEVSGSRAAAVRAWADSEVRQQTKALKRIVDDDDVVEEAKLAVIALVDESAQNSSAHDLASWWVDDNSLQKAHYNHKDLGTRFFEQLDEIQKRPGAPTELLEIYVRCLAWGFEGRYQKHLEELRVIRESVQNNLWRRLDSRTPSPLSVDLAPLAELPRPAPMLAPPWILAIGGAILLLVGLVLTILLYGRASVTSKALHELLDGEPAGGSAKSPGDR